MGPHIFADQASVVIKAPDGVMPAVVVAPPACGIYPSVNNKRQRPSARRQHEEDSAWPIVN